MRKKTPKESQPKTPLSLQDKAVENVFVWLITLIISSGIIGGGSYILFQSNIEIDAIDREILEAEKCFYEIHAFRDFVDIGTNGYLFQDEIQKKEDEVVSKILGSINDPQIDADFRKDALIWLRNILCQLSMEKGKLSGFVFVRKEEKLVQESLINMYSLKISYLQEYYEMLLYWDDTLPEIRFEHLQKIDSTQLQYIELLSTFRSASAQLINQYEILEREVNQKGQEIIRKIKAISLKHRLALVGVGIGIIVLYLVFLKLILRGGKREVNP